MGYRSSSPSIQAGWLMSTSIFIFLMMFHGISNIFHQCKICLSLAFYDVISKHRSPDWYCDTSHLRDINGHFSWISFSTTNGRCESIVHSSRGINSITRLCASSSGFMETLPKLVFLSESSVILAQFSSKIKIRTS